MLWLDSILMLFHFYLINQRRIGLENSKQQ